MIDDIRIDMNKVKASKEGKKVFNDLNKLIIGINNNKDKREDAVGGLNKSISDLDQLKQKQIIAFQNKLIHVVYQLLNSFCFNKESAPFFSQLKSEQTEENIERGPRKPLWFKINKPEFEELTRYIFNNENNKNFKITVNKRICNLKNAERFWTEVTTCKTSKNDKKKLYKELIQKDIDAPEGEKRNNIKNIIS